MAQTFTKFRKDISRLYSRPEALAVYAYLRNEANYADTFHKSGFTVRKDEVIRSQKRISADTGLSEGKVRSAINYLKAEQFISQFRYGKYAVFSTACELAGSANQRNTEHDY